MKKSATEKRTKIFLIRLTPSELNEVSKLAKKDKAVNLSSWARGKMLGKNP